jgi:hypothetical protein
MWFAVCDASLVPYVNIADQGNGICEGNYIDGPFDCTVENNLFGGQKCKTYTGEILLQISHGDTQSPDIQKWLTNVGLGDLVTAGTCTCTV